MKKSTCTLHGVYTVLIISALTFSGCIQSDADRPTRADGDITNVFATMSVECGEKVYTLSTGNNSGSCTNQGENSSCTDNKGNSTEMSCTRGCSKANGSGSCVRTK